MNNIWRPLNIYEMRNLLVEDECPKINVIPDSTVVHAIELHVDQKALAISTGIF